MNKKNLNSIVIFFNKNAANGKHRLSELEPYITRLSDASFDVITCPTDSTEDLQIQLDQYLDSSISSYLVYGGDGSLHALINAIVIQKKMALNTITLGLIAAGTGNDWLRNFKGDTSWISIQAIIDRKSKPLDIGKITYINGGVKYFVNIAGMGFNAAVIQSIPQYKSWGQWAYYLAIIATFFVYKSKIIKFRIDQNIYNESIFLLTIGLGRYAGGNMKLCPEAILDDGLFDINIIRHISRWDLISNILRLRDGSYLDHTDSIRLQANSIEFIEQTDAEGEADGEYIGRDIQKIEVMPSQLNFYVSDSIP